MPKYCKLCGRAIFSETRYVIIHECCVCEDCVGDIAFEVDSDCLLSDEERYEE